MENIFFDIGLIIIIATLGGFLVKLIRQPFIPAYVITGVIIGPVLGLVTDYSVVTTLSEIGIAFLLFIVGLEINFRKLKEVAFVSVFGGTMQVLLLFFISLLIAFALGFQSYELIYIALIVAFSSTMVVMKILSERKELDSLHGKIVIGILLVEDFFAVTALSILSTLDYFSGYMLVIALFKAVALFVISMLLIMYIMPYLFRYAAKSQELLFLLSISVCFFFSILSTQIGRLLHYAIAPFYNLSAETILLLDPGFSIIIGAFIGGIGLANSVYSFEVIGKVRSLRDFFATIFFVALGMELSIVSLKEMILPIFVLFMFIIIVKPFIIMSILSFFHFTKRPSFLSAMSLTQIGEFSLIIVAQGLALGHVSDKIFTITIVLTMLTISLTPYAINYQKRLYNKVSDKLSIFERHKVKTEKSYISKRKNFDVLLCGYDRVGYSVAQTLKKLKKHILIVDFNPQVIEHLKDQKQSCVYGDLGDLDTVERLNLKQFKLIVSTISDINDNLFLVEKVKKLNPNAAVVVMARNSEEAIELYDLGADYVIVPHMIGGDHVSFMLKDFSEDFQKIIKIRKRHIRELHRKRPKNYHLKIKVKKKKVDTVKTNSIRELFYRIRGEKKELNKLEKQVKKLSKKKKILKK